MQRCPSLSFCVDATALLLLVLFTGPFGGSHGGMACQLKPSGFYLCVLSGRIKSADIPGSKG